MSAEYANAEKSEKEPVRSSTELNEEALESVAGGVTPVTPVITELNCHMPPPLYE